MTETGQILLWNDYEVSVIPIRRTLKVEETGLYSGLSTKPFIRLRGRWLQRAGFQPGSHVVIEVVRQGELKITVQPQPTKRPCEDNSLLNFA
ncbi:MAG: SymE family type I addiction module toxin [Verrucomicrobiia bacterium]|jgi:hypothetical protein